MPTTMTRDDPKLTEDQMLARMIPFATKLAFFRQQGYEPHYFQSLFHTATNPNTGRLARFRSLAAGRRGGKTISAAEEVAYYMEFPSEFHKDAHGTESDRALHVYALTENYKRLLPAYRAFKDALIRHGLVFGRDVKERIADKTFEFTNGSIIEFRSADEPDSLRGAGLDILWMDEAAFIRNDAAYRVVRPALADKQGIVICTTTPDRQNWFYDVFWSGKALAHPGHFRVSYWSLDNPWFPVEEWEEERDNTHPMIFAQEYCNTPDAPVWMADLSFKPLGEVRPGDHVIGWEKGSKAYRKLCSSLVGEVRRRTTEIVKVVFESGASVTCTPDHLWATAIGRSSQIRYRTAEVGREVFRAVSIPSECPTELVHTAGWLGGIYDGEGSRTFIAQCPVTNPEVYVRIGEALKELGFRCTASKRGWHILGGKSEYLRFLLWTQPAKTHRWLAKDILSSRFTRERVVSVEPAGVSEVVALTTRTGNYTAWGLASRNCASFDAMKGNALSPDWLHYYSDEELPDDLDKYIGVDPAISLSDNADRFVITCLGVSRKTNQVYLLDQWAGRIPFPDQIEKINEWYMLHSPISLGVESVAYQAALAQQLLRLDEFMPIQDIVAKGRKFERILGMSPYFKSGRIRIKKTHADFITEWLGFDPALRAPADDCLDSMEIALRTAGVLTTPASEYVEDASAMLGLARTLTSQAAANARFARMRKGKDVDRFTEFDSAL